MHFCRSKIIVFNIEPPIPTLPPSPLFFVVVPANIPDISVDGKELFTTMMSETARLDEHVFLAIQKLKGTHLLFIVYMCV